MLNWLIKRYRIRTWYYGGRVWYCPEKKSLIFWEPIHNESNLIVCGTKDQAIEACERDRNYIKSTTYL